MPEFAGFPPAALAFYEELRNDNSKRYWRRTSASGRRGFGIRCGRC